MVLENTGEVDVARNNDRDHRARQDVARRWNVDRAVQGLFRHVLHVLLRVVHRVTRIIVLR
ncbi:hypothetical protein D3C75_1368870 [compost metagenome]